jgi:hypothetical protein
MLVTEAAKDPTKSITSLYTRHPALKARLEESIRYLGDRNIYSFGATKYITNVKNHLVTNLPKMMKRYIYSKSHPGAAAQTSQTSERKQPRT